MNHIYYIGFYSKNTNPNDFLVFPATNTKMDYIISAIKSADYRVTIFALGECKVKKIKFYKKKTEIIDDFEKIIYVSTFGSSSIIIKFFSRLWLLIQLFFFLSFKVKKGSKVLYYHTYATIIAVRLSKLFNNYKLIFEVEEIFQAAWRGTNEKIKEEINYLQKGDAFILVNDIMASKCGFENKPFAVCYGDYRITKINKQANYKINNPINIVYAGVLGGENSDVYLSIRAVELLPKNYKLHILGYGSQNHVNNMINIVNQINKKVGYSKISYHGKLSGKEYFDFLADCQIGLSTRVLEDKYSDYTFPSKVLVYIGNNLTTVSSQISCIMKSKVRDSIWFYKSSTPESVAEVIIDIGTDNLNKSNQNILLELDYDFVTSIKYIFNEI